VESVIALHVHFIIDAPDRKQSTRKANDVTTSSNDRPSRRDQQSRTAIHQPYCSVGAGCLTSFLWKTGDQSSGWHYRFNLFRLAAKGGRVSQLFRPADLMRFVKLVQVMASVIADDGCLSPVERGVLRRLATELDELLSRAGRPANAEPRPSNAEEYEPT